MARKIPPTGKIAEGFLSSALGFVADVLQAAGENSLPSITATWTVKGALDGFQKAGSRSQ